MTILTILLTVLVLSMAIYKGYRFSMRLYTRGVLGVPAGSVISEKRELHFETDWRRETSVVQARDYGLRYARAGLWFVAIAILAVVVIIVLLIFTML